MHDARSIRDGALELRAAMERRGALGALAPALDRAGALDAERRLTIQAVEERKNERNLATHEVARRKRAGEDAADVMDRSRALGEEIARLERELAATEGELTRILLELPNATLPEVPAGGEDANVVVRTWGDPRPSDGVQPHWDLAARLGIVDLERAAKISGSGFVVYRGAGARLVRGLVNFFLDLHVGEHGYQETWAPALVNRATMTGTGQLPKFEDDAYAIAGDDLFLIPTAEVPVTNLFRDELLDGADLPIALAAYTPCFRREAGSAGKDTRGVLRTHQFDKVELVRITTPEDSRAELDRLTTHAETALQRLELPYRVKLLAAGDTGFSNALTFDLECWAPGVGAWLEVSSCSSYTDFQARRANIRYRPAKGEKPRHVHTLNGSGLAVPRTFACLLEHHQQPDGSVRIPAALQPYVGTDRLG